MSFAADAAKDHSDGVVVVVVVVVAIVAVEGLVCERSL